MIEEDRGSAPLTHTPIALCIRNWLGERVAQARADPHLSIAGALRLRLEKAVGTLAYHRRKITEKIVLPLRQVNF